ncbi:MAG: NUDIX hydrolase [Candidatus Paceibacterota bacterium]
MGSGNPIHHSAFVAAIDLHQAGEEKVVLVEHRASIVHKEDGNEFVQGHGWGLPGGMQDENNLEEPAQATAEREFFEEVRGLEIKINDEVVFFEKPDPESRYGVHTFFADGRGVSPYPFETSDPLIIDCRWFYLRKLPFRKKDPLTRETVPVIYHSSFARIIAILLLLKKEPLAIEILEEAPWHYSSHQGILRVFQDMGRDDLVEKFRTLSQEELDILEAEDALVSPSEKRAIESLLEDLSPIYQ